jgi:hypothetical protein
VCYFAPFRRLDGISGIANVMIFIPAYGESFLFVSDQCCGYATEVTTALQVCSFSEMWGRLGAFAAQCREGVQEGRKVGLAGGEYVPANLLEQVKHAMGDTVQIKPSGVLAGIEAIRECGGAASLRRIVC